MSETLQYTGAPQTGAPVADALHAATAAVRADTGAAVARGNTARDGGSREAGGASGDAAESSWTDAIADESIRTWARGKGWKSAAAAVESNFHLERLIGQDRAGRTLVIPREDAPPEEVRAFRQRLGVPDTPEGYALPAPEGAAIDLTRDAAQWMHEAGIPAPAAAQLTARFNAHAAQLQAQAEQQYQVESAAQVAQLKGEWGSMFAENADYARRAALHFLPAADVSARQQQLDKIERALGSADFLRFMSRVGRGLQEHMLVGSGDGRLPLSAAEARERIASLRADRAWTAGYVAGDTAKAAEMNRLHRIAFGGEQD